MDSSCKRFKMYFIGYNFRDVYGDGFEEYIDMVVPTIEGGLMKMVFQYRGYTPKGYHFIGLAEYDTTVIQKHNHKTLTPRDTIYLDTAQEWDWSNPKPEQNSRIHRRKKKHKRGNRD